MSFSTTPNHQRTFSRINQPTSHPPPLSSLNPTYHALHVHTATVFPRVETDPLSETALTHRRVPLPHLRPQRLQAPVWPFWLNQPEHRTNKSATALQDLSQVRHQYTGVPAPFDIIELLCANLFVAYPSATLVQARRTIKCHVSGRRHDPRYRKINGGQGGQGQST